MSSSNLKKMKTSMVNSRIGDLVPKKTEKVKEDLEPPPPSDVTQLKACINVLESTLKRAKQLAVRVEKEQKSSSRPTKANQKAVVDTSALMLKQALADINAAAEAAAKEAERLADESPSNTDRAHGEGVTDGLIKALDIIKKLQDPAPDAEADGEPIRKAPRPPVREPRGRVKARDAGAFGSWSKR